MWRVWRSFWKDEPGTERASQYSPKRAQRGTGNQHRHSSQTREMMHPDRTFGKSKSPPLRLRSGQNLSQRTRGRWGTPIRLGLLEERLTTGDTEGHKGNQNTPGRGISDRVEILGGIIYASRGPPPYGAAFLLGNGSRDHGGWLPASGSRRHTTDSPTTTIVAEVRMHDFNWGIGNDRDLLGRFSSQTFSLPGLVRTQTYFMRLYSGSSPPLYSRYAAALHVDSPL